jgi:hypothetical protein
LAPTKYSHRQNLLASTKYWRKQNINIDKVLAATKYWGQQKFGFDKNIAVGKISVSTKYSHQQNVGIDKMLASTKSWCRRRRIPLLFGSAESTAADFSQTSLKISYVSLMVLIPLHAVAKCGVASGRSSFMVGVSPILYWLIENHPDPGPRIHASD